MRISTSSVAAMCLMSVAYLKSSSAFAPSHSIHKLQLDQPSMRKQHQQQQQQQRTSTITLAAHKNHNNSDTQRDVIQACAQLSQQACKVISIAALSLAVIISSSTAAFADTGTSEYDGFAEYAKDNQMEKSDVGCFINKCGDETKNLFSNPRGIKGVSCLGRCKGEQSCATRCFAEFGSEDLNNWLSCTIEDNECVKVPKNVDNSKENKGYTATVKNFNPKILLGDWYKTDGLNPNYDLFDCQSNSFKESSPGDASEVDMGIFFRVPRPASAGGGFWENDLTEHMIVDAAKKGDNPTGRTMHTAGKMFGLGFDENWYILGESEGKGDIPPFVVVAYRGHTLQGNYEGSFIYSKERVLPSAAVPAVTEVLAKNGLEFKDFTRIDNTCSTERPALNDEQAGTGTSTTDWIDLVVGEGGVIDWVVPGWRGEYKNK